MKELTCTYCKKEFTAQRLRECCNRTCSSRLAQVRRGLSPWELDAELWLEEKSGTLPFPVLCRRFNSMAKRKGWAARSKNALHVKLQRLNLRKKCTEDNLTRRELARVLGINPDRVRAWTKAGLPWKKVARNQSAIRVEDLKQFLLTNPERATHVPIRELGWLIGEDAAEIVANAKHSVRGYAKPVVCLDTGRTYPGVKAAARENFVVHSSITSAIERGGTCAGYRWAYFNQIKEQA